MMMEKDDELQQLRAELHALSSSPEGQPQLPVSAASDLDSIPTPTQVTSRALPSGLMPLSISHTQESEGTPEASGNESAGLNDMQEGQTVLEDSDDDLTPIAVAKSRSVALPIVFENKKPLSSADVHSTTHVETPTDVDRLKQEIECLKQQVLAHQIGTSKLFGAFRILGDFDQSAVCGTAAVHGLHHATHVCHLPSPVNLHASGCLCRKSQVPSNAVFWQQS